MWDIAERNEGTTVDELIEINNLSNDSIYPGFKYNMIDIQASLGILLLYIT